MQINTEGEGQGDLVTCVTLCKQRIGADHHYAHSQPQKAQSQWQWCGTAPHSSTWQYACDQISQSFPFRICKLQAIQKVEVWQQVLVIATQHLSSLQYIILSGGCGQRWEQNMFSSI